LDINSLLKNRSPLFVVLIISLISSLLTISLYIFNTPVLEEVDLRLSDFRFRSRGPVEPSPDIVIVAIDEKSVNEIGRWPWSRSEIADLVDKFFEYDVKTAVFDIVFSEEESAKPDSALGKSIKENKNVILGYFFRDDSSEEIDPQSLKLLKKSKIGLIKFLHGSDNSDIRQFNSAELNIPEIAKNARGFGFFNIIPDNDGVYRHAPLVLNFEGNYYPSLNLEGVSNFSKKKVLLTLSDFGVSSINLNEISIPTDESGELLLKGQPLLTLYRRE
jgi:adenylate cyclase